MSSTETSAAEGPMRLTMKDVRKSFGATKALRGVSLELRPGEVMALIGENGAGKSTLMKVLSGAHKADEGQMQLDGNPYTPTGPLHARECGVAMIYQELSLAPHLSVMENILLGVEPTKGIALDWKEMRKRAEAALEEVGIGDVPAERPVQELAIGVQQLVEIARAVALDCKVLVLDEPTSSLTQKDIRKLFALINRLRDKGISIVYISHFLEEVQEISDRYTVIRDGESVGAGITEGTTEDEIIALMVGREVDDLYPRSPRTAGELVLEVKDLKSNHGLESASLELRRGEVLGVAGLVGAGRTEMMRAIFGMDRATGGTVKVSLDGKEDTSGHVTPARRWKQGVGMLSEDRKTEGLALGLSIADNSTLPKLEGLGPWRFVTPKNQQNACVPFIEKIPIKCQGPAQQVQALSGGNQQKVAIARLLHADVDILLLDEPTRGVDVGSKAQIYQLIDELAVGDPDQSREPKAVLMISSYIPELMGTCDRIAVMARGHLREVRDRDQWTEHELMQVATGQVEQTDSTPDEVETLS